MSSVPVASTANATNSPFESILTLLTLTLAQVEHTFYKVPGSAVLARYVRSSHQNDPGRTVLELILIAFAVRTLMQSRSRDKSQGQMIKFSEKVLGSSFFFPFGVFVALRGVRWYELQY